MAVDLSQKSLDQLGRRIAFSKVARFPWRAAPVRRICADLYEFVKADAEGGDSGAKFDYMIASNVLHHVTDPGSLLAALSGRLKMGGLLRMVTYPKASRLWMRETSRFLKAGGLSAGDSKLVRLARERVRTLPADHRVRSCFESQPETGTRAGLVDAFFNACENPLSPLEWKTATEAAGLEWIGETQTETSRSTFLDEIAPELAGLNPWTKLQILDDLLELCANPILWLRKVGDGSCLNEEGTRAVNEISPIEEMRANLSRVQELISGRGLDLSTLLDRLKKHVGPRVDPRNREQVLPGLSVTEYEWI